METLSDKITKPNGTHLLTEPMIHIEHVKSFIEQLKEITDIREWKAINKLAGDKLV